MNIALCFCVRNCEKYLKNIFLNINRIKTLNVNVFSIFVYDNCSDNSGYILEEYQKNNNNVIVRNILNTSMYRTIRIAKARNSCLEIVYNELNNIKFHIMIDCDDICSPKWNIGVINHYLTNFDNNDWDCISFFRDDYYDIWALMFDDFKHHCWGFIKYFHNETVVDIMKKSIIKKIKENNSNSIEVMSAFNGFCIYKTKKFKGLYYDGMYENFKNLVTEEDRINTIHYLKKYNLDVEINNNCVECCEHLFYNVSAFKRGCKIKISKFKVV